ncbi:YdeI/OmpD-associated family protein [Prauserella cavernicola]|uniref:YdeI/OmpD-associated family protein n=1 Tax=Prauserella cavernicola TaxID=2800127 RepID=A0A934QPY2_9PSEU|nr:YdeI/OmpD-associated family protein [Prauserella cavernicola]MBK1783353.1 YdeI/OmpD-associated family protein [Prauserella cavernicola]
MATDVVTLRASGPAEWRAWLERHSGSEREVWLVIENRASATPSVRYHEAIEHALCFGWIDSQARKRDATSTLLRFTPRNPRGTWSRVNRERAARMIEQGLMTERGLAAIELAKRRGTWQLVADDEDLAVPDDLRRALDADPEAARHFAQFPPSSRRLILEWVAGAKKPRTRARRIERTATLAARGVRAHPGARAR